MADVSGSFTATGQSSTAYARQAVISLGGTFVGSVNIERLARNGTWYPITTLTAGAVYVLDLPETSPIRMNCTAYTSGTATYSVDRAA